MPSALLTLYRSLTRHKLYAVLNIGGLALGIAVFLVLFLFVRFETGYDRALPGWERIWMVERTLQFPGNPKVEIPSLPQMLAQMTVDHPGTTGARLLQSDVAVQNGTTSISETMAEVDPAYFRLFPFPSLEGDAVTALARPDGIVITEAVAQTYFGKGSSIGRSLTVLIDGTPHLYRIGAVLRPLPGNISYASNLFIALKADATGQRGRGFRTFLSFVDEAAATRVTRDLPAFIKRHPDPNFPVGMIDLAKTSIVPLADVHLAADNVRTVVTVLGMVGTVALMLAVVNYINLATARAALRAREIAIRKVVGATRRALVLQLLSEALIAVTLAALIGLALAEISLPLVNATGGTDLAIVYWGTKSILPPLVLLIATVSILAGFYPAFVISRFQPAGVLAAARTPGGSRGVRLRNVLVVLQFGIAIALMISTGVLVAQTRHVRNADIGFGRHGLVMVPAYGAAAVDPGQRAAVVIAIRAIAGVAATTISGIAPGGGSYSISAMHRAGAIGEPPMILQATIGDRFFETYGVALLAGRRFDPRRFAIDEDRDDQSANPRDHNVILNRTAVQRMGFATPSAAVGQVVSQGDRSVRIIGVVGDMRFATPREPLNAVAYSYRSDGGVSPILVIRTAGDIVTVLSRIEMIWNRIVPTVPSRATTVDQKLYESFYRQDEQRTRLFMIGAVLAVVIGCIGLYGLAAFDTARRVKEIGIRKTLGASTRDVLMLLIGQFLRPVLIANLIAVPVAYVAMRQWLAGFDDRVALSPWLFVGAIMVAGCIAVATIVGQTWRIARSEPARALRHE